MRSDMTAVLQALARACGQLGDPAIIGVMVRSIAITVLVFIALGAGVYGALMVMASYGWLDAGSSIGFLIAMLVAILAGWLLFRVVAVAVLQFYADRVVLAVEARHYPQSAEQARALPFREDLANSLRGVGRTVGMNILALPFAGLLLVTGIGPAVVFFAINAWLLGRELTDMAWLRYREGPAEPSPVPRSQRLMLGGAVAAIMLVPFVNLIGPIIGAAAGTHLAHQAMSSRSSTGGQADEKLGEPTDA